MKKRIFGMLLMGAMVVASMSMFTSCKDYDDDINNLQSQIDAKALKTDLESLRTALASQLSTTEAALKTAINDKADAAKLTTLAAQVATLETKIAAIDDAAKKGDVESLATALATLTGDVTDLKTILASKANSSDLESYATTAALQAAEANIAQQKTAIEALQTKLDALAASAGDKTAIEAIQTSLNTIKADLAKCALSSDVTTLKTQMETLSNSIDAKLADINVLTVLINKKLTSLVFRPDFYENGIEAVSVDALSDTILALKDESKRATVNELWGVQGAKSVVVPDSALTTWYEPQWYMAHGWDGNFGGGNNVQYYTKYPVNSIDYHMNPTTANLDGAELSFYTNVAYVQDDPGVSTRAAGPVVATPNPTKVEKTSDIVTNGIITLPFEVNREALNSIRYSRDWNGRYYHNGNEAFIALQANVNDTTVTSDYALLLPRDIDILALGGKWINQQFDASIIGERHLWTKLITPEATPEWPVQSGFVLYEEGKLNNVPYYTFIDEVKDRTLKIQYDGTIDLNQVVETHFRYGYRFPDGKVDWDDPYNCQVMTAELMQKLGLHYEFEAIHYISGSNKTDEWEHIQLSGENNSIAAPRSVDASGKMIKDEVAGREVIGRMPLVRASLVSEDGKVLAIGYIPLEITSQTLAPQAVTIDLSDAYMNCTAPASLTWAQVEALILKEVQLSKAEFESIYRLETTWGDGYGDLDGNYYSRTNKTWGNKILADELVNIWNWQMGTACQYTNKRGYYEPITSYNNYIKRTAAYNNAKEADKPFMLIHPMGSVYERMDPEGQQTTVLEWNVGSQTEEGIFDFNGRQSQAVNTYWATYYSGASAASKGLSTNDVEVTVAYKQMDANRKFLETGAIYVTLRIPAGKLHFAYAEVAGKDLSHWYQNNSYLNSLNDNESDAYEIHINTPTPALGGSGADITRGTSTYAGLQDVDFGKVLDQTFKKNLISMGSFDKKNFSKFTDVDFSYHLIAPKKDNKIAWNLDAQEQELTGKHNTTTGKVKNSWIVNGVTGNQYLLVVKSDNANQDWIEIAGYKDIEDGKVKTITDAKEKMVVKLVRETPNAINNYTAPGTKIAVMPNRYAQDIINYVGRYDMFATDNNTSYLDSEDKTFTAFIEIKSGNPCYQLMMDKSYFKARFLRPINATRLEKKWTDALNTVQTVNVAKDLVKLIDWRGYQLTTANDDSKKTVDAKFYGIADSTYRHFYVDTTAIYTDHGLAKNSRVIKNSVSEIESLDLRDDFESLKSKFLYFDTEKGTLNYKNNETNVGTFHLYVPVYIVYSFGEFDYNGTYGAGGSALAMGLKSSSKDADRFNFNDVSGEDLYKEFNGNRDKADNTTNKATSANDIKRPLYTLKTYAVITVQQTTNSGTQAREK